LNAPSAILLSLLTRNSPTGNAALVIICSTMNASINGSSPATLALVLSAALNFNTARLAVDLGSESDFDLLDGLKKFGAVIDF
jgi:hypothetical protein